MTGHIQEDERYGLSFEVNFVDLLVNKPLTGLSPPVKYFTDLSKAVLLLWIFYVFVLSCVCYVFVHVYLYVLCGHLLGKGLTSLLSFMVSNC